MLPRTPGTRRLVRGVIVIAAAAVFLTLASRWPRDNVVHVVLGAAAPGVADLHLRYAPVAKNGPIGVEDWARDTDFRFPEGTAPRVVTHEPRVADGDYVVEIEILKASHAIVKVQRRVTLAGGTTSIDVSEAAMAAATVTP
jgi:hypothetical protein